jgi:hypothetical protein
MADLGIPHPLDPDWKWKEFARRTERASGGRLKRLALIIIATTNRLFGRFDVSVQHTRGKEIVVRVRSIGLRLYRLQR